MTSGLTSVYKPTENFVRVTPDIFSKYNHYTAGKFLICGEKTTKICDVIEYIFYELNLENFHKLCDVIY